MFEILVIAKSVLITAASAAVTGFSIYLACKKIGTSVAVAYSVRIDSYSAKRIADIILVNRKDRQLSIFSIQAVINGDMVLDIKTLEPPTTLGPYESRLIQTEPVSEYLLDGERFFPSFGSPEVVDIHLLTDKGLVRCKPLEHPDISSLVGFAHLRRITKGTREINGVIYDERARFAITYETAGGSKTVLVHQTGLIQNSPFAFNALREQDMQSVASVLAVFKAAGYSSIVVDDLSK